MNAALDNLKSDHLAGRRGGAASICSARREVLETAIEMVHASGGFLLVEATAKQVNQFGGYTGMTPSAFAAWLGDLADTAGLPRERIVLGADHLGPYAWRDQPAETAMANARELIRQCVTAGFRKFHLDTGFGCADDPAPDLPLQTAADRAVDLCRVAESSARRLAPEALRPLYVIGAEVPLPGGALEDPDAMEVTRLDLLEETLHLYEGRFRSAGLSAAWQRVAAVVVQPGVEFGDARIARYRPEKAAALSAFHAKLPGMMTYEVHSTDYQPADCLTRLVEDHFILLKAGPCLTNAFREAVFALERIEAAVLRRNTGTDPSRLSQAVDQAMAADPRHWRDYYSGTREECSRLRRHSLRDRIRYYWGHPGVAAALDRLTRNLSGPIPFELIRKHFPQLPPAPEPNDLPCNAAALVRRHIRQTLEPYFSACR